MWEDTDVSEERAVSILKVEICGSESISRDWRPIKSVGGYGRFGGTRCLHIQG
jgi:hypothetical protein